MDYERVFHETRFECNRLACLQEHMRPRGPGFYLLTVADDAQLRKYRKHKNLLGSSWHGLDQLWMLPPAVRQQVVDDVEENVVLVARHVQREIGCVSGFPRDWRKIYENAEDFAEDLQLFSSQMNLFPECKRLVSKGCIVCANQTNTRCSDCYVTRYCSRECQMSDRQKHKPFCRLIKKTKTNHEEECRWNPSERRMELQHVPSDGVSIGLASLNLDE